MRSSKKEKLMADDSKLQVDQVQADHDLFLEAFEKPTQIYRYLRARHLTSATFLHRNLSYMKERSVRTRNTRSGFKVDSLLAKAEAKCNSAYQPDSMKLKIQGFYDSAILSQNAELEAFLTKTVDRKRKLTAHEITSSSAAEVTIGKTSIPCNPDSAKVQPVTLPVDSMCFRGCSDISPGQGYTLNMRIKCQLGVKNKSKVVEDESVPSKRRKSRSLHQDEENTPPMSGEDAESNKEPEQRIFGAQLVIFDAKKHCQLTSGDYQLVLADLQQEAAHLSHNKPAMWHAVNGGKSIDQDSVFKICPTLKFSLSWQHPKTDKQVKDTVVKKEVVEKESDCNDPESPKKRRIFYQFMYNTNTCQQTEARDDTTCPWCLLNCIDIYPLLKHLRTCHPRMLFTYSEHPKGGRIDVMINEHYDGSYSGNPHDLYSYMGYAFCRDKPVQRMPITQILVWKQPKMMYDMTEFDDANTCEEHTPRPMVAGHNRLYFHTLTCALQWPSEIDVDSDGQLDPQWLRQKTQNLIDDFTDVNEGEKEIMKMWNLHVMHHNFIGDCQLPKACADFVQEYGPQVIRLNLIGNFMLHLVNLYDFGLIRPELIYKTMMQLFRLQHKILQSKCEHEETKEKDQSKYTMDMMDTECDEEVARVIGS